MDNGVASEPKGAGAEQPAPEVLSPRAETSEPAYADESSPATNSVGTVGGGKTKNKISYRPSHRATFIGLAVVATILAINAGVIWFIIRSQSRGAGGLPASEVTVSQSTLDKLGVNQTTIGDSGVVLTIVPNTSFKGKVTVGGDISVAGQLKLNGTFAAANADLTQLEAGKTTVNQLAVSDGATFNTLDVEQNLNVLGTTHLQGAVTVTQLFTINNSANIAANLSVGGAVSAAAVTARSLVTTSTLTISGHVITAGNAPSVVRGPAVGSNGTVSISGDDAAGTVAVNAGSGAGNGLLATVTFQTPYDVTPHVVVTPIGNVGSFYISRNATGFTISVSNTLAPAGYAFDYIVEQ